MAIRKPVAGDIIHAPPMAKMVERVNYFDSVLSKAKAQGQARQNGNMVWAINKTGADLRQGDVAAYDGSPYSSDMLDMMSAGNTIELREPEDADAGRFVIVADPLEDNQGGWVYTSGVCLARVQAADGSGDDYDYADIDAGGSGADPTVLKMTSNGAAYIIDKDDGYAGEYWGLIRFPILSPSIGTSVDPAILVQSGESANTDEWEIDNQPEEKDGVKWAAFRLFWSGVSGEPVYQYIRTPTYDSLGNLVAVSAESRTTAFATDDCP